MDVVNTLYLRLGLHALRVAWIIAGDQVVALAAVVATSQRMLDVVIDMHTTRDPNKDDQVMSLTIELGIAVRFRMQPSRLIRCFVDRMAFAVEVRCPSAGIEPHSR